MSKSTIKGRIKDIVSAEINAYLDKKTDPMKVINIRIRDADKSIKLARSAHLDIVRLRSEAENTELSAYRRHENIKKELEGNLSLLKKSNKKGLQEKSAVIEDKMRQLVSEQIAVEKQIEEARIRKSLYDTNHSLKVVKTAESKRDELVSKKSELVARMKSAQAQGKIFELNRQLDINDGSSLLSKMDRHVRQEEVLVQAKIEIHESSLDKQLQQLDGLVEEDSVDARMRALKSHGSSAITSNTQTMMGNDYDFSSLTLEEAETLLNEDSDGSSSKSKSRFFRNK